MQFTNYLGHKYNLALMTVEDLKLLEEDIENDITNISEQLQDANGEWPFERDKDWENRASHAFSIKRRQLAAVQSYIERGGVGYQDLKFSQLFMHKAADHLPGLLYKEVYDAATKEHESATREAIAYKGIKTTEK